MPKLFELDSIEVNKGVLVFRYKPTLPCFVLSLDLCTGDVLEKEVLEYSVHRGVELYQMIVSSMDKPIFVSTDHSLIVYDIKRDVLDKASPRVIQNDPESFCLVCTKNSKHIGLQPPMDMLGPIGKELLNKVCFIWCKFVTFRESDRVEAYDLTVKDTYTFFDSNGICYQDTMSLYAPLTTEAQEEAKQLLPSMNKFQSSTGAIQFPLKQDYILALYILTNDSLPISFKRESPTKIPTLRYPSTSTFEALIKEYGTYWHTTVYVVWKNSTIKTTFGRYILNVLHNIPTVFFDQVINSSTQSDFLRQVISVLPTQEYNSFVRSLSILCGLLLKQYPISFGIDDLQIPSELVSPLRKATDPYSFNSLLPTVMSKVKEWLRVHAPTVYIFLDSGTRGSWGAIQQMLVARGFVADPTGVVSLTPVLGNYKDGLSAEDIYRSAPGWRKGIMDKSLGTADSGYLSRKLVYLLSPVSLGGRDCRTTTGLTLTVSTPQMARALVGRYLMDKTKITTVPVGSTVTIRSPIFCKDPNGICEVCYGDLLRVHNSKEIGVIAALALGERGTQLVLKTFHTGGAATLLSTPKLPDFLRVRNFVVYAVRPLKFTISISDPKLAAITSEGLIVNPQVLTVFVDGKQISWELNTSLRLKLPDDPSMISLDEISFEFEKGEEVGEILAKRGDVTSMVQVVHRLLEDTSLSYKSLLDQLWNAYATVTTLPMVHFELIVSVMHRVKDDIRKPWRLDQTKEGTIVSYIDAIAYESPLLATMFANPSVGIERLLVSDVKEPVSVLEDLVT